MVHQAIKVEQQLKRKNMARRVMNVATNSWRPAPKWDEFLTTKPKIEPSKNANQL